MSGIYPMNPFCVGYPFIFSLSSMAANPLHRFLVFSLKLHTILHQYTCHQLRTSYDFRLKSNTYPRDLCLQYIACTVSVSISLPFGILRIRCFLSFRFQNSNIHPLQAHKLDILNRSLRNTYLPPLCQHFRWIQHICWVFLEYK